MIPHPAKEKANRLTLNFCNTPLSRLFSLHSTPELGDLHNVLLPSFPNDRNGQGPTLFAKCQEPIHASFPNGPGYIPVAEGDNKVLGKVSKQLEEEVVGHAGHAGSILLTQQPPEQSQPLATYGALLIQPQQGGW
jgi:hypothetical protein